MRLAVVFFFVVAVVAAQTGTGNVQGVVRDPSGAVVAGAKITITHVLTTRQYDTVANEVGFYLFPSLQNGNYKLTVQAPGMQTWEGELLLQVGQTAVVEAQLKVGATVTEVTVMGDVTPLVTTAAPTLGNVMERARSSNCH